MTSEVKEKVEKQQPPQVGSESSQEEDDSGITMEKMSKSEVKIAQYQNQYTFAERFEDSTECRRKHADCVPLIIERASEFKEIKAIENCKFLFGARSQVSSAMVRAQKDVQAKQMWFYVHTRENKLKMIYPQSQLGLLHTRYGRSDGNLYILYSDKNIVTDPSQTFFKVMQILTIVLLIVYAYLYIFGVEDVLRLFGYIFIPAPNNSTQSTTTTTTSSQQQQSKIEL